MRDLTSGTSGLCHRIPTVQPGAVTATIGVLSDSSFVSISRPFAVEGDTVISLVVRHRGNTARVIDSLVEIGSEMHLSSGAGGNGALLGQPWAYRDIATLDRDDGALMVLRQAPARTGDELIRVSVARRSIMEDRVSSVTMYLRTARLSTDGVQRWLASVIDSAFAARFGGRASAEAAIRIQLFRPEAAPAVRRLISGSRGTFFFERVLSDTQHHWEHRTSAGLLIGAFRLPREWILQDAADTTILAIRRTNGACDTLVTASVERLGGRTMT